MNKIFIITVTAYLGISIGYAYKINPLNRSYSSEQQNSFTKNISESVHEEITTKAINNFQTKCLEDDLNYSNCLTSLNNKNYKFNSIIRGNWWSDDPNQMLYKVKHGIWLTQMKDAERRARNNTKIDSSYKMLYRTHFGDMQFMHSMASKDGESPDITKKNVLMWIHFLYEISIGNFNRNTKFEDVKITDLEKFFDRHQKWEIQWVLQPEYRLNNKNDFRLHALGSLLHTVQDSYSASHTERIYTSNNNCPNGRINKFLSYTNQNKTNHSLADGFKGYSESVNQTNNPLIASEQLIEFSMKKADWNTVVEPYLSNYIFCLDDPKPASAGNFNKM